MRPKPSPRPDPDDLEAARLLMRLSDSPLAIRAAYYLMERENGEGAKLALGRKCQAPPDESAQNAIAPL